MKKIFLFFIFWAYIYSIPRFTVEDGVSCNLCHINPTGAGLRNDYGTTVFSMEELVLEKTMKYSDEDYSGIILEHLQFGADLRFQVFKQIDSKKESKTIYYPMQGDLYTNLNINKKLDFYLKHDILSDQPVFYTLISVLPNNGYIRFGEFTPTYGIRLDDNSAFIRGGLKPVPGIIEAGLYFSDLFLTFSTANNYITSNTQGLETSDDKNFTLRAEYTKAYNVFSTYFGLSLMTEKNLKMKGLFGGASFKKVTWIGELDLVENWLGIKSLASFSEFSYILKQGLHLTARFELFDIDIEQKNNAVSRITLGTDLFPLSFFEVKLQSRFSTSSGVVNKVNIEHILQFHTWF